MLFLRGLSTFVDWFQDFYKRKIDAGEFEAALELAQRFHLNPDAVYKKQWLLSDVNEASLALLDRIKVGHETLSFSHAYFLRSLNTSNQSPSAYIAMKLLASGSLVGAGSVWTFGFQRGCSAQTTGLWHCANGSIVRGQAIRQRIIRKW